MKRVNFPAASLTLEGARHHTKSETPAPGVVVCHPHPLYGGDMENSVVTAICEALAAGGIEALRFNFRGVGGSQGRYGDGVTETGDARAALDYLAQDPVVDVTRLGLCGYSFGGMVVAVAAARDARVKRLVLVSPALDGPGLEKLRDFNGALLVLAGSEDEMVTPEHLTQYLAQALRVICGADHFWRGQESMLAAVVTEFFKAGQ